MKKMFSDIFKLVVNFLLSHFQRIGKKSKKKKKKKLKIDDFFKETLEKITNLNSYGTVLHRSANRGNQLYNGII